MATTRTPSSPTPSEIVKNMPPGRKQKGLRNVKPPLSDTRLSRLIYFLICTTALLGAYYSYRLVQHKTEVGGWWNLALGRHPGPTSYEGAMHQGPTKPGDSVEDKINDLARAFGMPSNELASAIAVAVRNYVPPASLSSVAAKETGPAVKAVLQESEEDQVVSGIVKPAKPTPTHGVMGEVLEGIETLVGMDEPM